MYCAENGVLVSDKSTSDLPGTLWWADLYRCKQCRTEIVTDFGLPIDPDSDFGRPRLLFDYSPSDEVLP